MELICLKQRKIISAHTRATDISTMRVRVMPLTKSNSVDRPIRMMINIVHINLVIEHILIERILFLKLYGIGRNPSSYFASRMLIPAFAQLKATVNAP